MHIFQLQIPNGFVRLRRTTFALGLGLSFGFALAGYIFVKRFWFNRSKRDTGGCPDVVENLPNGVVVPRSADFIMLRSGRSRATPSTGSSHRNSIRPSNIPAGENDLITGLQRVQEVILRIEKALFAFDMVKNRSEKNGKRSELLSSVLDRLRILEADIFKLVQESGYEKEFINNDETFWSAAGSQRAGTLSVLSDDSFLSAFEELPLNVDDADVLLREPLNLDKNALHFYHQGLDIVKSGGVNCRKIRSEFCCCEDDSDFKAKVWCIRQAFTEILSDERNRVWLSQAGRQLIADVLRHARKDPTPFYKAYDAMIQYLSKTEHMESVERELKQRGVPEVGFWDVVLDYILIDAFEDLSRPPSAVLAVTRNLFLSHSMKESTLATVIWSMLKAKRSRLLVSDGFISHFYDISEAASPAITLGFLGTDEHLRDLCHYFKEQTCSFIVDIFNVRKVRYTSQTELAEDIRLILETRLEMIQTRLITELLPPS